MNNFIISRLQAIQVKFLRQGRLGKTRNDHIRNDKITETMGVESLKYLLEKTVVWTQGKNG